MKFLKKLLGASAAEATPKPQPIEASIAGIDLPLGLRLGGAIAIDPLIFKVAAQKLGFEGHEGHSTIEAYGMVDLGGGAALHRFYLSDDAWLQVKTTSGQVDELMYFVFHETINPPTSSSFKIWVQNGSPIGTHLQRVKDRDYFRVWGDTQDLLSWAPPIVFDEAVYKGRPAVKSYALTHYAMLYQREVPDMDRVEALLISAEDYGPTEFCVVYSLGINVTTADLTIT